MQASYDGVAFIYARNQALDRIGVVDVPEYAYVTTFVSDGWNLNVYIYYVDVEG